VLNRGDAENAGGIIIYGAAYYFAEIILKM
jgi:hypothetical protein